MTLRPDDPVYVISVAARLAGLPCWMLRQLDNEGVVRPVRTAKNRRLYSESNVAKLAYVRYLTAERGVNVAGVRYILEIEEKLNNQTQLANGSGGDKQK